jgi:hypothetical protein
MMVPVVGLEPTRLTTGNLKRTLIQKRLQIKFGKGL